MDSVAPDALVSLVSAELRSIEAGQQARTALDRLTRALSDELGDACAVFVVERDARVALVSLAHRDSDGEKLLRDRSSVELSESAVISQVVKTGRPVVVGSTSARQVRSFMSPRMGTYLDVFGLSSLLLVPMRAGGLVVGCLAMLRVELGNPYPAAAEAQLQLLADELALALSSGGLRGGLEAGKRGLRAERRASLGTGLASFIRGGGGQAPA